MLDRPINREVFLTYVDRISVPEPVPDDIVVPDSLGSHIRPAVREAIQGACAQFLFLPPYSPHVDPIEMAFSKLKALLRKTEEHTVEKV